VAVAALAILALATPTLAGRTLKDAAAVPNNRFGGGILALLLGNTDGSVSTSPGGTLSEGTPLGSVLSPVTSAAGSVQPGATGSAVGILTGVTSNLGGTVTSLGGSLTSTVNSLPVVGPTVGPTVGGLLGPVTNTVGGLTTGLLGGR
jgi:hypothetical protein